MEEYQVGGSFVTTTYIAPVLQIRTLNILVWICHSQQHWNTENRNTAFLLSENKTLLFGMIWMVIIIIQKNSWAFPVPKKNLTSHTKQECSTFRWERINICNNGHFLWVCRYHLFLSVIFSLRCFKRGYYYIVRQAGQDWRKPLSYNF